MYCDTIFHSTLEIHIISALSKEPNTKCMNSRCQQRFVLAPGAFLDYNIHRSLSAYISDSGKISVIAETIEPIPSLIPENIHTPLSMEPEYPFHISTYKLVANMPIYQDNPLPDFIQCGKHSKIRTIHALIPPELSIHCRKFFSLVTHYISAKLTELVGGNLTSRVLTSDSITEVIQHGFHMKSLTVTLKHVTISSNENKSG